MINHSGFTQWFLMASLAFTGCVSASKLHEKEAELAVSENRVSELEAKLGIASKEKTKLEGSVSDMARALEEANKRKAETEKRIAEFQELTNKFRSLVDSGKLTVKVFNGRMVVALSTDVLFSSGSAKLAKEGIAAVKEVTNLLKEIPDKRYQVEGYTDNIPIRQGQYQSNWELASARAMMVLKTMLDSGMPPERVSAASYGENDPVQSNETKEGQNANRRIQIAIVPDLSQLPGFEELKKYSAQK